MLDNPKPGVGSVAEFQVSPIPWLTSSILPGSTTVRYDMPFLASSFAIQNMSTGSADMAVGFSPTGIAGSKRIRIKASSQFAADFRFRTLYLAATTSADVDFDLAVGLTGISARDCVDLAASTGSAYFAGIG